MDWKFLYLSPRGRINRLVFWFAGLGLTLGCAIVIFLILLLGDLLGVGQGTLGLVLFILLIATVLSLLVGSVALAIKRLHDRNKSGWWIALYYGASILQALAQWFGISGAPEHPNGIGLGLAGLTLVIGLWFLIELGFLRGTAGANAYGPDPLVESRSGI